jgi:hypothetical protein
MAAINRLTQAENREVAEEHFEDRTNVELDEDGFLTDYFDFDAANTPPWNSANADNQTVRPLDVAPGGEFHFSRQDLACSASAVNHVPNVSPPQKIKFALTLLDILERVRARFNSSLEVDCAHVCSGHTGEVDRCCRNDRPHILEHENGVAVDFHPSLSGNLAAKNTKIRRLWGQRAPSGELSGMRAVCDSFNKEAAVHAGTASHADLPTGYAAVEFKAQNDVVTGKLNANPQQALATPEVNDFRVHLALVRA